MELREAGGKAFSYCITQATPEELQALIALLVKSVVVSPQSIQLKLAERSDVAQKEKRARETPMVGLLRPLLLSGSTGKTRNPAAQPSACASAQGGFAAFIMCLSEHPL